MTAVHGSWFMVHGNRARRGSILLYVVWVVMLLSLLVVGTGSQARFALELSDRLLEQLRAIYVARGALQYALGVIAADPTPAFDGFSDDWAADSTLFEEHAFLGGSFSLLNERTSGGSATYGFADEERRLNLNTAPEDVLQRLVETVGGLSEADAVGVAQSIADWRDEDNDERPRGAEGLYYRSREHGYDCKDGPLENIEELQLVRGVTPDLYRRLEPYVTVYGSGRLNLNTAGPEVLRSLGLSEAGVAGLREFRTGEDGVERTSDDRLLVSMEELESQLKAYVPVEDLAQLTKLARDHVLAAGSDAFRTTIVAGFGRALAMIRVWCLVDRHGTVLLWSER